MDLAALIQYCQILGPITLGSATVDFLGMCRLLNHKRNVNKIAPGGKGHSKVVINEGPTVKFGIEDITNK